MTPPRRTLEKAPARTRRARPRARSKRIARVLPSDLTKLQLVSSPRVSPDGSQVVFVVKRAGEANDYSSNLWLVPVSGRAEARQLTVSGKDSLPCWAPDGDRIAFVSERVKGRPQVCAIRLDGGEGVPLTDFPEGKIRALKWSPDGALIAVAFRPTAPAWTQGEIAARQEKGLSDPPRVLDDMWYRLDGDGYFETQRHRLYVVPAAGGPARMVYDKDNMGFFSFDFAPDSRRLAIATNRDRRAAIRPWKDEIVLLDLHTGKLERVPDLPEGPKEMVTWSPDGKHLAYAGRLGRDGSYSTENLELFICDAARGGARSVTAGTDYCLGTATLTDTAEAEFAPWLRWSADSRTLYTQIGWQGETHVAAVDRRRGGVRFLTRGAATHLAGNLSADGRVLALTRGDMVTPQEVCVVRIAGAAAEVRQLTDLNRPYLQTVKLARPHPHWVRSADGNRVQLWAMLPPDAAPRSRRRLPAVLEIHGGPHAQYGCGFFHEFQVLAAAGYAVFFANPRGSKGYGRNHCAAIRGAWGTADWTDMQAVIEFMKDHPRVDPKRMGVMGGSYGGYMTNWIIGRCHDFAGAITDRCVSNLVSMAGNSDWLEPPDHYFPGNFWDRPEARWSQSPIKDFGRVRTPTLIIHSEGDLRCNIEQGEQVFAALLLRGVPARMVRYPRSTSHGMSRSGPPDLRLHRLEQILAWWARYLG